MKKWIHQHALELVLSLLVVTALTAVASLAANLVSQDSRNLLLNITAGSGTLLLGLAAIWGLTWKKKAARDLACSFLHSTLGLIDALTAGSRQGEFSADTYIHLVDKTIYLPEGSKSLIHHEEIRLRGQINRLEAASREWTTIFTETNISLRIDIEDTANSLRCKLNDLVEDLNCLRQNILMFPYTSFSDADKGTAKAAKEALIEKFRNVSEQMKTDLNNITEVLVPHLRL